MNHLNNSGFACLRPWRRAAEVLWATALLLTPLSPAWAQETVAVVARAETRRVKLPAELLPFQSVNLHARIQGFLEKVEVDVGSTVRKGQLLAELSAPEVRAQLAEIEAKAKAVESQRAETDARLAAAMAAVERLEEAAKTPGAVAGLELIQARKNVEAIRGQLSANDAQAKASRAAAGTVQELLTLLRIVAPFDGVITQRLAHPGALVSPTAGPILRLEQLDRLRVVVAVPESELAGLVKGANVPFQVPGSMNGAANGALRGSGKVARISRSLDPKTRTMPVELDAANPGLALAPGMYAEADWPVQKLRPSLLVPATAVVTTTEKMFVIRASGGVAEHVPVRKGGLVKDAALGDLVEVFGDLQAGDAVVKRASDEIRAGSPLR